MFHIRDYPLLSDQVDYSELETIVAELQKVLSANIEGEIVEFGCYVGTTSIFLQRCLATTQKELHVYDSFNGLPEKVDKDESPVGVQFTAGQLAAGKKQFITNFRNAKVPLPTIHKGWFNELKNNDIPPQICFAFLDGDYYESITDSLTLIWPRLSPGATVIIDDYQSEALPGARRAVDEWIRKHAIKRLNVVHSLAVIHTRP